MFTCFTKWSSVIYLDLFWKQSFLIELSNNGDCKILLGYGIDYSHKSFYDRVPQMRTGMTESNTNVIGCMHRDHSIHTERPYMHCHGITCTRSFCAGLTSAEDQMLECFKLTGNNIFIITMKI
jgi:hypothetical protein